MAGTLVAALCCCLLLVVEVPMCVLSLPGGGLFRLIILHTGDFRSRYGQVDASGAECTRGQVRKRFDISGQKRLLKPN